MTMQGHGRRAARIVIGTLAVAFACGFAPQEGGARNAIDAETASGAAPAGGADAMPLASSAKSAAPGPEIADGSALVARDILPGEREAAIDRPVLGRALPRRAFVSSDGELAWQAVHGGVDGRRWRSSAPPKSPVLGRRLHGIGFPDVARAAGGAGEALRVYRPLVSWQASDTAEGGLQPIPHVRCMGLSPAAVARRAARYEARILELSMAHDISASLVKAVVAQESCFNPAAESRAGALGLMQLMPATARWLEAGDPRNAEANLAAGIRYLAALKARFGDLTLALAAYNAGPGNVERYGGVPPFAETRKYIKRVLANHRRYAAATALAAR